MGVDGLWTLLEPVKKEVKLSVCRGKKIAVDLNGWIKTFSQTGPNEKMKRYLCYSNLFFRTLKILSMGISLVFVLDGPNPPKLKRRGQRRGHYSQVTQEYKKFLEAMGIPVLESDGEAEKLCALLNERNIVDGVLTEDGDTILYGANTVYTKFNTNKSNKVITVEEYTMTDIQSQLGFTRRDLVAFALVSKGDFCEGIAHVGVETFWKLYKELKHNNVEDVLNRLLEWTSNRKLKELQILKNDLKSVEKAKHCKRCSHEGTKQSHNASGCSLCSTTTGCVETLPTGAFQHPPCCCRYHSMEADIKPYSNELKVRSLALEQGNFPQEDVVEEFLDEGPPPPENFSSLMRVPDFKRVCEILLDKVHWSAEYTLKHLAEACMKMKMYGLLPQLEAQPLRVEKKCKEAGEQCYLVEWRLDIEGFSGNGDRKYELKVPVSLITEAYPEIASQFESTETVKSSQKSTKTTKSSQKSTKTTKSSQKSARAPGQKTLPDMLNVVKKRKLDRPPRSSPEAGCSSEQN